MTPTTSVRPGVTFGRYLKSLCCANGDAVGAHAYAAGQDWRDTPAVALALKGSIAPLASEWNDTSSLTHSPVFSDYAAVLRPLTVLGRMKDFQRVPFATRMIIGSSGLTAYWVDEGQPIPVSKMDLDSNEMLTFARVASMAIFTKELARSSAPGIELVLTNDVARAAALAIDKAFVDPANAGNGPFRPASVTYNAPKVASTGKTLAQIDADLAAMIAALGDTDLTSAYWIMAPHSAVYLIQQRGVGGGLAYPKVSARGGELLGLPVLTTNAVAMDLDSPEETFIALVTASEILVADDGASRIEISEHAAVQMNDTPIAGAAAMVSLWQNGLIGLKAERAINWQPRRATAAAVLTGVQF